MLFEQEQLIPEVKEVRCGVIWYALRKDTVHFRIHFNDWQQLDLDEEDHEKPIKVDLDYTFDGLWLTKRDARNKMIQQWEISKTPKNKESFRLGKGPFPLPFGIKKADILQQFNVILTTPDPNTDTNTHILKLKPKKDSSYAKDYIWLELTIAKDTLIPAKIAFEKTGFEITTVTWSKAVLDKEIPQKKLTVTWDKTWEVQKEPLQQKK